MQHHLSFDEGALHWIFTRSLELNFRRNFIQRCLYRIYIIERLVMAGMSRITNLSLPSLVEVHRSFSRSRSIPQFLSPFFETADTQLDSLYLWVDKFALRFQPCTCRHEVLVMQCQLRESKWKKSISLSYTPLSLMKPEKNTSLHLKKEIPPKECDRKWVGWKGKRPIREMYAGVLREWWIFLLSLDCQEWAWRL